jgi:hypothetical protein
MEKLDPEPALQGLDTVTHGTCGNIEFISRLSKAVVTCRCLNSKRTQRWEPKGHNLIHQMDIG